MLAVNQALSNQFTYFSVFDLYNTTKSATYFPHFTQESRPLWKFACGRQNSIKTPKNPTLLGAIFPSPYIQAESVNEYGHSCDSVTN